MLKYFKTQNPSDCFGCKACKNICNHNAISFKTDNEGFDYPILDQIKCINCNLCTSVCPIEHFSKTKQINEPIVIACQNKNKKELSVSSSGGLFTLIAKHIISQGGSVYGAAFETTLKVKHIRINKIEELEQLRGSKYVQSDINDTFKQVKKDLQSNIKVYFVGTPCQISGLKLYLRKEYPNLITTDLICHGVPSQKAFDTCLNQLNKKYHSTINQYKFRDKNINGWSCWGSSSSFKKGHKIKNIIYDKNMKLYFNGFITGDMMRYCCYECPFTTTNRTGDLTLADYWSINKYHPNFPNISQGVSLLLINSHKGENIWHEIKEQTNFLISNIQYASQCNHNLTQTTPLNKEERSISYNLYFNDYKKFTKKYYPKKEFIEALKQFIKYYIKKSIFKKIYNLYKSKQ